MLSSTISSATVAAMPKSREQEEAGVWNFRDVPRDVIIKAKIEAALESKSVKALLMDLVESHWLELDRKGLLPKK